MSEISGELLVKDETKVFGSNGFRKREFVLKTDSQYPQEVLLELIQDKCDLLDKFNLGDNLRVSYNLNGRSWVNPQGETKYFNSVQGWRIEKLDAPVNSTPSANNEPAPSLTPEEEDDLPF